MKKEREKSAIQYNTNSPESDGKADMKIPKSHEEIGINGRMREEDISVCESGLADTICGYFLGRKQDIRTYSPLTLAYIGDAVYDLIIRTVVVGRANRPARELHKLTIKYVSANAQSKIVQVLMSDLTTEEQAVFRRGRNAKPYTTAKNVAVADYMRATGFEALLGYLYLTGNMQRILELVKKGVELVDMKEV